jgi:two-component system phosphate regulon sensor histidine kinase PhoR
MSNHRLIWQIFPSQLGITIAALLAFSWYGASAVHSFYLGKITTDLEERAHLISIPTREFLGRQDMAGLQDFCQRAGENSHTRITIIATDGTVLADSDENPQRMENHKDRPEIIAALSGTVISSLRFSHTLQKNLAYLAIPLYHSPTSSVPAIMAVIRTAVTITSLEAALSDLYRKILWGCLLVALFAAFIAWVIARRISQPLEQMRHRATLFAAGDFSERIPKQGAAELINLAQALNEMADQLDERFQTIVNQRNQLRAVFASMVEGVITVDSEERILDINEAGCRLLNLQPEQIKGKSILLTIRNTHLQNFVKHALASPTPIEGEFSSRMGEDGREKFFFAHGARLHNSQGLVTGALIVLNDITTLRRLESVRQDFVANVSHELKTPITSIKGFAETLLDGALDEKETARNFIEIINKQAERLHAIIEDLLALSRIEQDVRHQGIPLQSLPIQELLATAVQSSALKLQQQQEERNITLVCDSALTAAINPPLLEQAIINLLDNALKYSAKGSPITVTGTMNHDEVLIQVEDHGIGIAEPDINRIFERFYRVDKAHSARIGGTGLGLAIVKHIIAAHHGRITVTSNPGQGSVFTLHLPIGR